MALRDLAFACELRSTFRERIYKLSTAPCQMHGIEKWLKHKQKRFHSRLFSNTQKMYRNRLAVGPSILQTNTPS